MRAFEGKIVLLTGAARGLGRDYARYFAADGASLVLTDLKAPDSTAADAAASGAKVLSIATNVSDATSVQAAIDSTRAEFGKLDILINNAGMWRGLSEAGLLECPEASWDAAWNVNVKGSWLCYKSAVPLMRENGWGRIINISSMAAVSGGNAYGLTKAVVEHMTQGMAREVGKYGITVNCLAPGISAFEGAKSALPSLEAIVQKNPVPRMGTTRDLYDGLAYLASDAASWVTGETLRVDGGAVTR